MKPYYCITAINRLTHEREKICCSSRDKALLKEMRSGFLLKPSRKRTHIYPRIEIIQENLFKS